MPQIPIENIYYMLAYAWDRLDEAEAINVGTDRFDDIYNLFTKVLVNGTNHLLKQGLKRDYVEHEELTNRLRGKILFQPSIKQNILQHAQAYCAYDELSFDILHNCLIRATLEKVRRFPYLDSELQHEIRYVLSRFPSVNTRNIGISDFKKVRLHRNNNNYKLILSICELIWRELLLTEETGEVPFTDFVRDKKKMPYLFERFLFNFYKRHLEPEKWEVKREAIKWRLKATLNSSDLSYLPSMGTDISLISSSKHFIIDAKYYPEALKIRYEKEKLISSNLYQVFSYVQNVIADEDKEIEGILIYPEVEKNLSLSFEFNRWNKPLIRVCTINLNQNWKQIEKDLLAIIS
ncbi:5-methylcytosine restriction system specificity protein McrC [Pontibacter sp. MBLB2868]|uniref:5-methylcytosine restriction system specificity protein McrC n=1 Tax=Pontibacter sp. MBLB2868 TaxID=3451555 RepID=UPI003F7522DE